MTTNDWVDKIPEELKARRQWMCYKMSERDGKPVKLPVNPNGGGPGKANDPSTWRDFSFALKASRRYDGLEYVFCDDDPYVFIDLDHCVENGTVEPWAQEIIDDFNTYTEFSRSGKGIHIICAGIKPGLHCRSSKDLSQVEIYSRGRVCAITGDLVPGTPATIENAQSALDRLYYKIFGEEESLDSMWRSAREPEPENLSDDTLLARMFRAANGARVEALYRGDISRYGDDDSSADLALCNHLAWWCDGDTARIDRLFRRSALYRDKWERADYRERTISCALAGLKGSSGGYKPPAMETKRNGGGPIPGSTGVAEESPEAKKRSQGAALLEIAFEECKFWFQTPDGETYVRIPVGPAMQTMGVSTPQFRAFLRHSYYTRYFELPRQENLKNVIEQVDAEARASGNISDVYLRLARTNDIIYLDLGRPSWEVAKITRDGWEIVKDAPAFRRSKGMQALPIPQPGGSIDTLRQFVNLTDEQFVLYAAFLVGAFATDIPFPVLAISGEQGSAKSTAARVLKELIDPNAVPLKLQPKEDRDVIITASNNWLLAYDNLSWIPEWLSDVFAALATGIGYSTRELYTNNSESIITAKRPLVLNGITDLVERSDLLDRSVILVLEPMPESKRVPMQQLWAEFDAERPRLLGALLDAIATALRNKNSVQIAKLPRMADFSLWVASAEQALPWKRGEFLRIYGENREAAHHLVLEGNPVAEALLRFVETTPTWSGSMRDLYDWLRPEDQEDEPDTSGRRRRRKTRKFPGDCAALGKALRRLAPNLRRIGIDVQIRHGRVGSVVDIVSSCDGSDTDQECALPSHNTENHAHCDGCDGSDGKSSCTTPSDQSEIRERKEGKETSIRTVPQQPSQPSHRHQPEKPPYWTGDSNDNNFDPFTPTVNELTSEAILQLAHEHEYPFISVGSGKYDVGCPEGQKAWRSVARKAKPETLLHLWRKLNELSGPSGRGASNV